MAGSPQKRMQLKAAEEVTAEATQRLEAMRANLVRAGLDPDAYDPDAAPEPPPLKAYRAALPLAITRLANQGQSIEEIRITLGFSEWQEREWRRSYVEMDEAVLRVRAREQAFWMQQQRSAAKAGDRSTLTAINALITKKFFEEDTAGDATEHVHIHSGVRLAKPEAEDD